MVIKHFFRPFKIDERATLIVLWRGSVYKCVEITLVAIAIPHGICAFSLLGCGILLAMTKAFRHPLTIIHGKNQAEEFYSHLNDRFGRVPDLSRCG